MDQSDTPVNRPTGEHPSEGKDALRATVPFRTRSMEDHRLAERVEHALRATPMGQCAPSVSP